MAARPFLRYRRAITAQKNKKSKANFYKKIRKIAKKLHFKKTSNVFISFYVGVVLISLALCIFFYVKNNIVAAVLFLFVFASIAAFLLTIYIIENLINKRINNFQWVVPALYILCIFVFIFPISVGYVEGTKQLRQNNFVKMKIYTKNEVIPSAGLIGIGKGFYIFRYDNKNIFIPETEIIKLESVN
jgi:hypothetical protein